MEGKEERKNKFNRETKEEVSREREREGEKGEDGTVAVKRKCINPVSAEAFDIFSQGEESESCGNSWCDLWDDSSGLSDCGSVTLSCVPVVTDVLVFPSSALAVRIDALSDWDWEFVEPQTFSFFRKRQAVCAEDQEGMNYEGTPVKAPPASRRKITPHTTAELVLVDRNCAVADRRGGPGKRQLREGIRRSASSECS